MVANRWSADKIQKVGNRWFKSYKIFRNIYDFTQNDKNKSQLIKKTKIAS